MKWIDSHCHLNHPKLAEMGGPEEMIRAAVSEGISGMLTINCRMHEEFDEILAIANAHDNVWCTLGTHPHDASGEHEKAFTKSQMLERITAHKKIVGIGESGLDYFYDFGAPEDQVASFRKHLQVCLEADLPVVIHARDADQDVIRILKEESAGDKKLRGVMHCFSSSPWMADEALDLGFYISFSGMVTFNKSVELQDICRKVPLERILVETDAPYLAPTPYRGKTNQPAYVRHTGYKVAELKELPPEQVELATRENFFTLFNRAA